jgi:hypothetical protein
LLTARYHIATIIAIFLSLGVGIVIGGTLGQKWAMQAENSIVDLLTDRYEMILAENQAMKKQLGSLELFLKTVSPSVQTKVVWWYKTPQQNEELLTMVLNAAGVEWVEKDANADSLILPTIGEPGPDYILVTDPLVKQAIEQQLRLHDDHQSPSSTNGMPRLIDATEHIKQLTEPARIVEFMLYMKQLVEGESYAAAGTMDYRRYSGME